MSNNLPLGTHFGDGVRSGPIYTGQIPSALLPFNPTLSESYTAYSAYGSSIMMSPQNTWNITPQPAGTANVVAGTSAASITSAGYLTLFGDNVATKYVGGESPYVQFDWPRVVTVNITVANPTVRRITIFGTDWYGFPLQQTYVTTTNFPASYPTINNGSLSVPAKAFYTVTNVYIDGALGAGSNISLGVSDIFGLPFYTGSAGDITSINWGSNSELTSEVVPPAINVVDTGTLNGTTNVVVPVVGIQASSTVNITRLTQHGAVGNLTITIQADVSFTVVSSSAADLATFAWSVNIIPSVADGTSNIMVVSGAASRITIPTTQVKSDSIIQLTMGTFGTRHQVTAAWNTQNIVSGVGFDVFSADNTETSTVTWAIMPPNWASGTSIALGAATAQSAAVPGSVFVTAPTVTSTSNILLTANTISGTAGLLSAPRSSIIPGVGFTITSSNTADTSTVNWTITQLAGGNNAATQGTTTLVAGVSPAILTSAIATNSIVLLTYNTLNTVGASAFLKVSARTGGTSFVISAFNNTNAVNTADISSVNWAILPANLSLPALTGVLGTFVPGTASMVINSATKALYPGSVSTATTGDVRGLYAPSTPSNGSNSLNFTIYASGADTWINQVSATQFVDSQNNQPVVGVAIAPLDAQDLYGNTQFYTGAPS